MPTQPSFSIILVTRHRLELLQRAIDSINSQDYDNLEILVIDNASDDPITERDLKFEKPYRIVRTDKMLSASANRNLGVREAAGDTITFLDDDDELLPGKFSAHARALSENPDIDFVYSDTRQLGPAGETLAISSGEPEITPFLRWRYIHLNALAVRKYVFDALQWNETMASFGDVEFIGRMMLKFRGHHIPEIHALWYRDNRPDQITKRNWRRAYENWRILCDTFDEQIAARRELRLTYHKKMLILSLMFADLAGAAQSAKYLLGGPR